MFSAGGTGSCPPDEERGSLRSAVSASRCRIKAAFHSSSVRLPATEGGIFMPMPDQTLYKTPFSAAYWRTAREDFHRPRNLAFAALMIAACMALGRLPSIRIHLTDLYAAKVTWGFLARSLCSMVCGPVMGLVFGFAEDTVSYLANPAYPYFPGYALTTMLGNLIYALFLYQTRFGPVRIFFAKTLTNLMNVFLGSLWSTILSGTGKGYLYYMSASAVTNAIKLIPQTVMLCVLFAALTPILRSMGWIPPAGGWALKRKSD